MSDEGEKQVVNSGSGRPEEVPDPELDNLLNGKEIMYLCGLYVSEHEW